MGPSWATLAAWDVRDITISKRLYLGRLTLWNFETMTILNVDFRCQVSCGILIELEDYGRRLAAGIGYLGWEDRDLKAIGIRWRPRFWLDRPVARVELRAFCRVVRSMEADGLVDRIAGGDSGRMTHCRPTAAMLEQADKLTGGRPDLPTIAQCLAVTTWGRELAVVARQIEDQA